MKVLGVETSSTRGGVALVDGGKVLAEVSLPEKRHHAQELFRAVEECLGGTSPRAGGLEGIAVSVGPGSFTGLRVGIACAKGLAWTLGLSVACVRTLPALLRDTAWTRRGPVACVTRAFQGKVYALVGREGGGSGPDEVLKPEELLGKLEPGTVLFGDGAAAYAGLFDGLEIHPEPSAPRASTVALVGEEMLLRGEGVTPEHALPRYLLKTEAERKLEREVG